MKHVLAVDDDPNMRGLIADYLREHDFRVSTADSGREVARIAAESIVDLIILDLKLANEDGLKLLRDFRTRSSVPIIVLTGQRRDEVDRIVGLELGADDYVTKPFSLRELLARIRAVLRRFEAADTALPSGSAAKFRFSDFELDARRRRLTTSRGTVVPLTRGELNLLLAFLRSPQHVLSREHLVSVSRTHDDVFDRSIDVQVLRLRRKLESDPRAPRLIRTEKGVGYVLDAEVHAF